MMSPSRYYFRSIVAALALLATHSASAQTDGGWKPSNPSSRTDSAAPDANRSPFAPAPTNGQPVPLPAGHASREQRHTNPRRHGPGQPRRHARRRYQRRRHASARRRPSVARIRYSPLHAPQHRHGPPRASDCRLDPARNRLRNLALRPRRPAQRQPRNAPRLSHAGDASDRR